MDEETDYFIELALQECERWIEGVTKKRFSYPDDPRKSLETGVLLCDLLNGLKPGVIRKINRLPTPIAGLDNLSVFLEVCQRDFGLRQAQVFDACDLEDLSLRGYEDTEIQRETEKRLKQVAITIFWLGREARKFYEGPQLDFSSFSDILDSQSVCSSVRSPRDSIADIHETVQSPNESVDGSWGLTSPVESPTPNMEEYNNRRFSSGAPPPQPQGGGGEDYLPPTRVRERRTSAKSCNPMQFVKADKKPLSETAKETIKIMEKQKAVKEVIQVEDEDWQSNLSNWKSKMRRKSQATHQRALQLDEDGEKQEEEEEEEGGEKRRTRPIKSIGSFYPQDEDDVFPAVPKEQETLTALGFTKAEETPRDRYGAKPTFAGSDVEFGGDLRSGMTFGAKRSTEYEFVRDSREYSNRSPEDSGFGDERLERLSSPKSRDEDNSKWSFDLKEEDEPIVTPDLKKKVTSPDIPVEVITPQVYKPELCAPTPSPPTVTAEPPNFLPKKISKVLGPRDFLSSSNNETHHDKKYIEKLIKISVNHQKGFGFSIQGGKELQQPIVIEKVTLGGAADVCELMPGDEIISINGAEVANHYQDSVQMVIDNAVTCGQIELKIKRHLDKVKIEENALHEEEETFLNERKSLVSVPEEARAHVPSSLANVARVDSAEEKEIIDQLVKEDVQPVMKSTPKEPEDLPPALPSAPPPVPMWNTFPSQVEEPIFDDGGDFLEEDEEEVPHDPIQHDPTTKLRTDILRRKSEFLGLKMEETEEYKKMKAEIEREKKEKESEKRAKEQRESLQQAEQLSPSNGHNWSGESFELEFDVQKKEREIIAQLERSERNEVSERGASGQFYRADPDFVYKPERHYGHWMSEFGEDDDYKPLKIKRKMEDVHLNEQPVAEEEVHVPEQPVKEDVQLAEQPIKKNEAPKVKPKPMVPKKPSKGHVHWKEETKEDVQLIEQPTEDVHPVEQSKKHPEENRCFQMQERVSDCPMMESPEDGPFSEHIRDESSETVREDVHCREEPQVDVQLVEQPEAQPEASPKEEDVQPNAVIIIEIDKVTEEPENALMKQRREYFLGTEQQTGDEPQKKEQPNDPEVDDTSYDLTSGSVEELFKQLSVVDSTDGQTSFDWGNDRMAEWQKEQERLIQPAPSHPFYNEPLYQQEQFEKGQEEIRRQHEEELRRAQEAEEERRREDARLLEKELAHQRELEELKIKREEERQRREEEAKKREEEQRNLFWEAELEIEREKQRIDEERILAERERERRRLEEERQRRKREEEEERRMAEEARRFAAEQERLLREEERRREEERVKMAEFQRKQEELQRKEEQIRKEADDLRRERERLMRNQGPPYVEPKKVPPPVMKKPLKAIPQKPSIKSDMMARREILEMNKRPGASIYNGKEDSPSQPVLLRQKTAPAPSREDFTKMNRRSLTATGSAWYDPPQNAEQKRSSWHETSPPKEPQALSKRSLKTLSATPRKSLIGEEAWIQETAPANHWLVEEAERRRVAEHSGVQRPRQDYYSRIDNRPVNEIIMPHYDNSKSLKPLPNSIKETLLDRIHSTPQRHSYAHPSTPLTTLPHSQRGSYSGPSTESPYAVPQKHSRHLLYQSPLPSSSAPSPHVEPLVAVSSNQRCGHCEQTLGHGAAMIIESLHLYYHVQCFRCHVCQIPLGTGDLGADVRVRSGKLHCSNCFSNDEVGLKYSRV